MTTYNGRSAQYIPGREVVNKEPPVSKYVVEKLYNVHRTRMAKMRPVVDCHVKIPKFLSDQTWKKTADQQKKLKIAKENEHVYSRIAKVEKEGGTYAREQGQHVKRHEIKSNYLRKLKEHGRLVTVMKIQKENEYFLHRIEKVQPLYTKRKCADWYRHHELFKAGRRTDPCAGHIMPNIKKDLLPKSLPPLNSLTASFGKDSHELNSSIYSPKSASRHAKSIIGGGSKSAGGLGVDRGSLATNSMFTSSLVTAGDPTAAALGAGENSQFEYRSNSASALQEDSRAASIGKEGPKAKHQQKTRASIDSLDSNFTTSAAAASAGVSARTSTRTSRADQAMRDDAITAVAAATVANDAAEATAATAAAAEDALEAGSGHQKSTAVTEPTAAVTKSVNFSDTSISESTTASAAAISSNSGAVDSTEASNSAAADGASNTSNNAALNELTLLVSRPFALPFEAKNCLVQVFSSKQYDELLHLKVVSSGIASKLLCERQLPIDKAYELVNAVGHSSQIVHSSENEDLASLSTLLINMFKEADDDDSGSLTFDEFQALMEQVELGISPQELRFVISEADENENGVVDYEEFVPLAVDLIQSFRARNRAKNINSQKDVEVDEIIMKAISTEELEHITKVCLQKIYEVDAKKYGLIRVPELKRCLTSVAITAGLRDSEISMMCQMLPRDQFDRVKYNSEPSNFYETLSKVRFTTMKNAMIEAQGSGLQKYLLDLCRDEEASIASKELLNFSKDGFMHTGRIPFRALINILSTSSRLSLSRLQVLVIMSEAHVQEGMINYFQFVPVVAKAIEIMFEPKALRQRAELIEKTDLSPEALLQGMSSEMFEQRLLTLFKSYDIDHSGGLDQNEFIACLESLDLQLTYGEMVALMAAADVDHTGILKFEDFMSFFTHNLLNLEREKHLRLLQSSMSSHQQAKKPAFDASGNAIADVSKTEEEEFVNRLVNIFKLSDPDNTGLIAFDEFETVMRTFHLQASRHLMDVMISELHITEDGRVNYRDSLSTCSELLKVYRARETAMEEHKQKEAWAEEKARTILESHIDDVHHIVRFLRSKIKHINETCSDQYVRFNELQRVFRSNASGLARVEANMLISRLLNGAADSSSSHAAGGLGNSIDSMDNTSTGTGGGKVSHSNSSGHHKNNSSGAGPRGFRSNFSSKEIFDVVFNARKTTIMRGLMEEIDSTALHSTIYDMLDTEIKKLRKEGVVAEDSNFLPVQSCFRVLGEARDFRLNRSQILFIISWAECFDKEGAHLEYEKFAEHCSNLISKLNIPEMLETRSEVLRLSNGAFDDKSVLNGMKEEDVAKHLEYAFAAHCTDTEHGLVGASQLYDVLKSIPRVSLSDREINAVVATFHIAGSDTVHWKDILQATVSTILSLCRERVIHRRVSLAATSNRLATRLPSSEAAKQLLEDATAQLKSLADRVLNYVKIQSNGDDLIIYLPIDSDKKRTGVNLAADEGIFFQGDEDNILYRGVRFMNWFELKRVQVPRKLMLSRAATAVRDKTFRERESVLSLGERMNSPTPAAAGLAVDTNASMHPDAAQITAPNSPTRPPSTGGGGRNSVVVTRSSGGSQHHDSISSNSSSHSNSSSVQYETVSSLHGSLPVLLTISAQENKTNYTDTLLVANVIDPKSMVAIQSTLAVKLPSIALVDRDAAQQFAGNLVDKLFIEESVDDHVLTLKMLDTSKK